MGLSFLSSKIEQLFIFFIGTLNFCHSVAYSLSFTLMNTRGSLSPNCYALMKVQTSVHAASARTGGESRKNERKQMLSKWASLRDAPTAHGPWVTIFMKGEQK